MNRLYLVRHGENLANITKEFSCRHVDYPLTPKGTLQAQQTAEYLAGKGIDEVYCSPLRRASETAEIIAARLGLPLTVMENWREIDVGELELQPVSAEGWALFIDTVKAWLAGHAEIAFPGGEDYLSLYARMRAGVEEIVRGKCGHNLAVVGHGGIFTITLKDLCGNVDVGWLRSATSPNCSVTELAVGLQEGRLEAELVTWAYHAHLRGAAADLVPGSPDADTFAFRSITS